MEPRIKVLSKLNNWVNSLDESILEYEYTFNQFGVDKGISRASYYRIKKYLDQQYDYKDSDSRVEISDNIRKVVESNDTKWQVKIRQDPPSGIAPIIRKIQQKYQIRVRASYEHSIEPPRRFKAQTIRNRRRRRYHYEGIYIDLTEVTQLGKRRNFESYELECEMIDYDSNTFTRFYQLMFDLQLLVTNSEQLYGLEEYYTIINEINNNIVEQQPTESKELNTALGYKPRNLMFNDLVYGGLVGSAGQKYRITMKADGVRQFVFIDEHWSIWLINPPAQVSLIHRGVKEASKPRYIIEAELIKGFGYNSLTEYGEQLDYADRKYILLGYDALYDNDLKYDLKLWGHETRFKSVIELSRMISNNEVRWPSNLIHFQAKKFYNETFTSSVDAFYHAMNTKEDLNPKAPLAYLTDGLIFMPFYGPYYLDNGDVRVDRLPINSRSLTKVSDVVKWKPVEQITIDLLIKFDNDNPYLVDGSDIVRATKENIDLNDYEDKQSVVGEFRYNNGTYRLTRLRLDKQYPNSKHVVQNNLSMINNPIDWDTLTGYNIRLMRKYHQRIKRRLYTNLSGNLLDIGTGRGADISKWRQFNNIVAIEPNKDNINDLRSRLTSSNVKYQLLDINGKVVFSNDNPTVHIIKAKGQDNIAKPMKVIGIKKFDVVSMMLSLSFFWFNEQQLKGLHFNINRYLANNGKFIYLTIDGNAVKELFQPKLEYFNTRNIGNRISQGNDGEYSEVSLSKKSGELIYSLKYNKNGNIVINIPNSIVGKQTESLVNLDQLLPEMTTVDSWRATEELFLSGAGETLTRLYTAGIIKRIEHQSEMLPPITVATANSTQELQYRFQVDNLKSAYASYRNHINYVQLLIDERLAPKKALIVKALIYYYKQSMNNLTIYYEGEHQQLLNDAGIPVKQSKGALYDVVFLSDERIVPNGIRFTNSRQSRGTLTQVFDYQGEKYYGYTE